MKRDPTRERIRRERLAWARSIPAGKLEGDWLLRWVGIEAFEYIRGTPPLRFIRHNGQVIEPTDFRTTDGGSINVFLQLISAVTRWKYGTAFVIHDWLWIVHHEGNDVVGFNESNLVLVEVMKTLMDTKVVPTNHHDLINVYYGVQSSEGKRVWERSCGAGSRSTPRI